MNILKIIIKGIHVDSVLERFFGKSVTRNEPAAVRIRRADRLIAVQPSWSTQVSGDCVLIGP